MSIIKLIVGLANPGSEYKSTRHNTGARYVKQLAQHYNQTLENKPKFYGYTGQMYICNQHIRLLIPATFMNLSGKAVYTMANFYQIEPAEILVAHDELDLIPGCAKLKFGGSHGGHNGVKNIIDTLGHNVGFYRLRIGIGHPGDKSKVTKYVLSKPTTDEQKCIDQAIGKAITCTPILIKENIEAAANKLHNHKPKN